MIQKYGEDFAEQFAAELLDKETFEKLMLIQDPEERRKAIALSVWDGIQDGSKLLGKILAIFLDHRILDLL